MLKLLQKCHRIVIGGSAAIAAMLLSLALLGPTSTVALAHALPAALGHNASGCQWQLLGTSTNIAPLSYKDPETGNSTDLGSFQVKADVYGAYRTSNDDKSRWTFCQNLKVIGTVTPFPAKGDVLFPQGDGPSMTTQIYTTDTNDNNIVVPPYTQSHFIRSASGLSGIAPQGFPWSVGGIDDPDFPNGVHSSCIRYSVDIAGKNYINDKDSLRGISAPTRDFGKICLPQTTVFS